MLTELDIVVFLKSHDSLDRVAELVFTSLKTAYETATDEASGEPYFRGSGLGFDAAFYANRGEMLDPEFEDYQYGIDITSQFWCVDLDNVDLEGPLSEYFARLLAFQLNLETATELTLETTEEGERLQIRAFRPNPQYRLDLGPTIPKVFLVEEREVFEPFEEEEEEEEGWADEEGDWEAEERDWEEDEDEEEGR
jgi:hypothetical protein